MIQRKQTLFLLAVTLIGILLLFIPFMGFTRAQEHFSLRLLEASSLASVSTVIFYPLILNTLVIILSIITIFLYKNRILQYKLANGLILLSVFTAGLFFLLNFISVEVEETHYTFGAFLPIVAAGFAFLAAHFIKKDELLVRSADRIR